MKIDPFLIGWVSQTSNAFNFQVMNSVIEFMGICLICLNCNTNLNLFRGRFIYIFLNHPLNSKRSRKWEKMFYFYFNFFFLRIHTFKTPQYYITGMCGFKGLWTQIVRFPFTWPWDREKFFSPIDIKAFLNDLLKSRLVYPSSFW